MSQIQGRVFDSSVYGWLADITVSLSASGYTTKIYVDGSLAARDASITLLFIENDNQDVSIAWNTNYIGINEVSIGLNQTAILATDVSVAWLDSNKLWSDASISDLSDVNTASNSVINDGSILTYNSATQTWIAGRSFAGGTVNHNDLLGLQGGGATQRYHMDLAQYNRQNDYLQDASMGSEFIYDGGIWNIDISLGYIDDVSIGSISAAQDGSALIYNTNGYWEYGVAGIAGAATVDYVDGSLAFRDASLNVLFGENDTQNAELLVHDTSIGINQALLLVHDTSIGLKMNSDASLSDLSDVSTGGIVDGDLIMSASEYYIPTTPIDISTLTLDASDYFVQKATETYGQIVVHDASLVQDFVTGSTYQIMGPWTQQSDISANVLMGPAPGAAYYMTPQVTGIYKVDCQISFETDTNTMTTKGVVFQDGTECDWLHFAEYRGVGAGIISSTSMTGLVDISTLDSSISVKLKHDDAGTVEYTFYYANLNIHRIGESPTA